METPHNSGSDSSEEGLTLPFFDHEITGDAAWRLARWREWQETGSMSGAIGVSPDGQIKPYPSRLFVPPPLDESVSMPPDVADGY